MVSHDVLRSTVTGQIAFDRPRFVFISYFRTPDGPLLLSAGFQTGNHRLHRFYLAVRVKSFD